MTFSAIMPQGSPKVQQCRSFFLRDAATQCARFRPAVSP